MLATLAIINLTIAATLINDTADTRAEQQPTAIVATVETTTASTDYTTLTTED